MKHPDAVKKRKLSSSPEPRHRLTKKKINRLPETDKKRHLKPDARHKRSHHRYRTYSRQHSAHEIKRAGKNHPQTSRHNDPDRRHRYHTRHRTRSHTPEFILKAQAYRYKGDLLKALFELREDFDEKTQRLKNRETHKFADHLIHTVARKLHDAKEMDPKESELIYEHHHQQLQIPAIFAFLLKLKGWDIDVLHSMGVLGKTLGDKTSNPKYYQLARHYLEPIKHTPKSMRVLLMVYEGEKMYKEEEGLALKYLLKKECTKYREEAETHLINALIRQNRIPDLVALIRKSVGEIRTAFLFGQKALKEANSISPVVPLTSDAEKIIRNLSFRDDNLLRKVIAVLLKPRRQKDIAMLRLMLEPYTKTPSHAYSLVHQSLCPNHECEQSNTGLSDRACIAFVLFRRMGGKGAFADIQELAEHLPDIIPAPESLEYKAFMTKNRESNISSYLRLSIPNSLFSSDGQEDLREEYFEFEHHLRRAIVLKRSLFERTGFTTLSSQPEPVLQMQRQYQEVRGKREGIDSLKKTLHNQFQFLPDSDHDHDQPDENLLILSEIHRVLAMVYLEKLKLSWETYLRYYADSGSTEPDT